MKQPNLKKLSILGICLASLTMVSVANAQSVRHDFMDATAARRDISRLKVDRARALRFKNWGKVAQDDRLISSDRFWIMKDKNKIRRSGVIPPR
jgi:hypothetical protein